MTRSRIANLQFHSTQHKPAKPKRTIGKRTLVAVFVGKQGKNQHGPLTSVFFGMGECMRMMCHFSLFPIFFPVVSAHCYIIEGLSPLATLVSTHSIQSTYACVWVHFYKNQGCRCTAVAPPAAGARFPLLKLGGPGMFTHTHKHTSIHAHTHVDHGTRSTTSWIILVDLSVILTLHSVCFSQAPPPKTPPLFIHLSIESFTSQNRLDGCERIRRWRR